MRSIPSAALAALHYTVLMASAASIASHDMWYNAAATRDFFDALPIGNGRLGAMIHGYTDRELIRLNEESIWSGGPRGKIPPTAKENLKTLQEQILNGSRTAAGETWSEHFVPNPDRMRRYQPAGELRIDLGHGSNNTSDYQRRLDLSNGIVSVTYNHGGVQYEREAFGNYPHNVLGFKLSAEEPGALTFNISLTRDLNVTDILVDEKSPSLRLFGTGEEDDTYKFASKAQLLLAGNVGTVSSNGTELHVNGADEILILYTVETAYHHPNASYDELEKIVSSRLLEAAKSTGSELQTEAIEDYQKYYNRTSIDLGNSKEVGSQPVPNRRTNWQKGDNITSDVEFMALQFNYGKYLLIQSSRPGTLPANLQGIWNRDFGPPWDSKFTLNINLEMNYWLAQPLDLPEIAEPVVDLLDRLAVTGAKVAKEMYGANGWCCHHNTDITGDCTPYAGLTIAAPYPLGGAWVAFEAIEYFRFTRDKQFATQRILPLLSSVMDFIYSWATEHNGYWITNPSCSPENSYYIPENMTVAGETTGIDAGAMNDRAIMWEIMGGFVEISEALGLDEGVEKARNFRDKVKPPEAGSFGQLLEYSADFEENEPGHRHFSPLVGTFPGTWTSPLKTPADAEMAYTLLRHRMDNGGGGNSWSVTWASVLHARLFDGAHALQYAVELPNRWIHENMFSRNGGYFQIDGNSGYVAGLVEMFLQSNAGVVHLGPAIPKAGLGLSSGSFRGWIARGAFKVDMEWKDGEVVSAEITSNLGNLLTVRVGNGAAFSLDGEEVSNGKHEAIETVAGKTYSVKT